ncbi:MAG: YajQ family cyclic di-GMP-binding protein [Propionibacteriaceae bacterium]|jgi:uncharacterized protein YajQ (UPF0234 family)|nr:YajQ family cyclic di-GMP-binding protein [Propionibacteriaceae bacterium]
MAQESSFDIVSKVDRQEVDNAINQAAKECRQRFDFKGTDTAVAWAGEAIAIESSTEDRAKAALDVVLSKLVGRKVDLRSIKPSDPRVSGKRWHITCAIQQGISQDDARKVAKLIRDEAPKSVKAQIQGDELRVTSKSRDDLQAVQKLVRAAELDFAVQFVNYR